MTQQQTFRVVCKDIYAKRVKTVNVTAFSLQAAKDKALRALGSAYIVLMAEMVI